MYQHGNALAERYNYLNRELESRIGLHHIETDYRHYEPSLGRFSGIDLFSEQMYEQTPYRYGYNNPIVYSDATGLFETRDEAHSFMMAHGYSGRVEFYIDSNGLSGYAVMVEGGAYDGTLYFYNSEILEEIVIEIEKGSKGGDGNIVSDIFYSFLSSLRQEALAMVPGMSSGVYGAYIPDGLGLR